MPDTAAAPDLSNLRSFVALVDLAELAADPERAGAYFRAFGPGDDATLLVFAATEDAGWVQWLLERVLAAGGVTPDACADVEVRLVDGADEVWLHFARHAHAVIGPGPAGWTRVRRPTYRWDELAGLREQAERSWGRDRPGAPYTYEDALAHVCARGWVTEAHARMGSVPEPSLARAVEAFDAHLPASGPRLLHVGNFVGVSLSYLLSWAAERGGLVTSVDPNIPHRGVEHPQHAVCDLLSHFGLAERHLLICGYSLEKCFSNDSVVFEGYDPAAAWAREAAPENVLPALAAGRARFDAAFIDGNHDPAYLRRELEAIAGMLTPGGLLVLDDVDVAWERIRALFDELAGEQGRFERVAADGRIGILRLRGEVQAAGG